MGYRSRIAIFGRDQLSRRRDQLADRCPRLALLKLLVDAVRWITGCCTYLAAWADGEPSSLSQYSQPTRVRKFRGLAPRFRAAAPAAALGTVPFAGRSPAEWPRSLQAEELLQRMPHTMASSAALARGRAAVQICGQAVNGIPPGVPCRRSRCRQAISSTADAAALVNCVSSRRFWAEQEPCAPVLWQLIDPEFPVRLEQAWFLAHYAKTPAKAL